ncbi:MAG: sensor histidine kinase [Ktedonobacterales bacterium]
MRNDNAIQQARDQQEARLAAPRNRRSVAVWWLLWLVWLPFFVPMFLSLGQPHLSGGVAIIDVICALLFLGLYLWTTRSNAQQLASLTPPPPPSLFVAWLPILCMLTLSAVMLHLNGVSWGGLYFFTCAAAAGRLPTRQAIGALALIVVTLFLAGYSEHIDLAAGVQAAFMIGFIGVTTLCVVQSVRASQKLREQREEMARFAATTAERLRIARDLHDLLGHNLALITLKSELAGRLIERAPARAATEIGEVERVSRATLQEVREAVAAWRQPTLADELRGAQDILAAAGIAYSYDGVAVGALALAPPVEAVLAWAAREGVTNVIRHSHARHCAIQLTQDADAVQIEITNDGAGQSTDTRTDTDQCAPTQGSGLRGLAERVAALGGVCTAGPSTDGNWRLVISVPLTPTAGDRSPTVAVTPAVDRGTLSTPVAR